MTVPFSSRPHCGRCRGLSKIRAPVPKEGAGSRNERLARHPGRHHEAACCGGFVGYGAPLTAFVVRDIKNALGCSLGPLTDYLNMTPAAGDDATTFHELGHGCGLMDGGKAGTIMSCSGPCGRTLAKLRVLIVRNPRHVTYF